MLSIIQGWFREAVALHGDDWPKIERYVAEKMSNISKAERSHLEWECLAMRSFEGDALN